MIQVDEFAQKGVVATVRERASVMLMQPVAHVVGVDSDALVDIQWMRESVEAPPPVVDAFVRATLPRHF